MSNMNHVLIVLLTILAASCSKKDYVIPIGSDSVPTESRAVKVLRDEESGEWKLYVGETPYYVNGAAAINYYTDLAKFGGNTIRLYSARSSKFNIPEILDQAYKAGLKVYLGLGMAAARSMDYSDAAAVAAQKELVLGYVRQYRNHPALLCWSVGNEVEISNADNINMWKAIGDVVASVHELDKNHPVTCTIASYESTRVRNLMQYAPDIDFLSINCYYNNVGNIWSNLHSYGLDIPYMVTEYGPRLYSSMGAEPSRVLPWSDYYSDDSAAKVEESSTEKEAIYKKIWENDIKPFESKGCLGSFAFVWGYQTSGEVLNWYSLFTPDHYSYGACDALQKCWTGEYPEARAPRIESRNDMTMNGKTAEDKIKVAVGSSNQAKVIATASTDVNLRYHWIIFRESDHKSDGSMPDGIAGLFDVDDAAEVTFKAPDIPGAYRMYVFVYDDVNKKAASACIPFYAQ